MEYLIGRGVPQRTAHHLVGAMVSRASERDVPLTDLPLAEFHEVCDELDESVFEVLGAKNAVAAFASYGSTAPDEVARQVKLWKEKVFGRIVDPPEGER